jgi:uncharacterized protein (TIGR03382 family)
VGIVCIRGEDLNNDGVRSPTETDPLNPDTDGDGISDGVEVRSNYPGPIDADPVRPGSQTDPLNPDSDGDGLPDGAEDRNKNGSRDAGETDPTNPDSDGGGVDDGTEVGRGSDPLDPADDFPVVEEPVDVCGDDVCGSTEDSTTCPADCPVPDDGTGEGDGDGDGGGGLILPEPEPEPEARLLNIAGSAIYACSGTGADPAVPAALLLMVLLRRRRR